MPLATLNDILPAARQERRAVVAINVANMETLRPVVQAAELEEAPVIVQVYHRLFEDDRAEMIAAMTIRLAEKSSSPIALHLDHGASVAQVEQAVKIGYTSVMIDGSRLPFEENIAITLEAAKIAKAAGASIEAEIGHVPFADGAIEPSTVAEAVEFVERTGVDALAISIGTAHGFHVEEPKLDVARADDIGAAVSIPLVLHGGTGVPEAQIKRVVASGVCKINVATEYQDLFLRLAAAEAAKNAEEFKPVDLRFKPVEDNLLDFVRRKTRVFQP